MKRSAFRDIRKGIESRELGTLRLYDRLLSIPDLPSNATKEELRRICLGIMIVYSKWLQKPVIKDTFRCPIIAPYGRDKVTWLILIRCVGERIEIVVPDLAVLGRDLIRLRISRDGGVVSWLI